MAAKCYNLAELKDLALRSANVIGLSTTYDSVDVDRAYHYATQLCGYENPESSDTDYLDKQKYLLMGMEHYFLKDVQRKYLLKFDVGDLKLGQVSRNVQGMIKDIEAAFEKAKNDPALAALFIDASAYFGEVVVGPGITDDATGNYVDPEDL